MSPPPSSPGDPAMSSRHRARLVPLLSAVLLAPALAAILPGDGEAGQDKSPVKKESGPPYPRVSLATTYEVDPHWPKKPSEFEWGHFPGIAVDRDDNVYAFTRAKPPVQVYAADGRFL